MEKEKEMELVSRCVHDVLSGRTIDDDTLYELAEIDSPEGVEALLNGAAAITAKLCPRKFDTCSIVNARSGLCPENCKWCAQSSHYSTHCDTYELVDHDEALALGRYNAAQGVGRYSFVASGRAVRGKALDSICRMLSEVRKEGIETCASLGLLGEEDMLKLKEAGISRYHCNLETAPSYFPSLCSTHTQEDKLRTIEAARKAGLKICCGGIIGMGETRKQRVEFAIKLREVRPCSIPINILAPIPGTPLEGTPLISEDEVLRTVALFRFVHPDVQLRYAGGRKRMSRENLKRSFEIGINGAIVGDMLTTLGASVDDDKAIVREAGYEW